MNAQMTPIWSGSVHKDWVDYNGHMNDSAYARVFSLSVDALMTECGIDSEFRNQHQYTIYTLETHMLYLNEAYEEQELNVSLQILDYDEKKMHVFFDMKDDSNNLIATSEQMLMGMDTNKGVPAPFPKSIADAIYNIAEAHKSLSWPEQSGRTIGIKKKQ